MKEVVKLLHGNYKTQISFLICVTGYLKWHLQKTGGFVYEWF